MTFITSDISSSAPLSSSIESSSSSPPPHHRYHPQIHHHHHHQPMVIEIYTVTKWVSVWWHWIFNCWTFHTNPTFELFAKNVIIYDICIIILLTFIIFLIFNVKRYIKLATVAKETDFKRETAANIPLTSSHASTSERKIIAEFHAWPTHPSNRSSSLFSPSLSC